MSTSCFICFQLYEEEKLEKERLKRDLENCKKELREAKAELDRQMKRNDASRVSETNDKRVRLCSDILSCREFFGVFNFNSQTFVSD